MIGIPLGVFLGVLWIWAMEPLVGPIVGYSLCRLVDAWELEQWKLEAGRTPPHSDFAYRVQIGPWILFLLTRR